MSPDILKYEPDADIYAKQHQQTFSVHKEFSEVRATQSQKNLVSVAALLSGKLLQ